VSTQHRRRQPRKRPAAKNPNAPPDGTNWIWWTKEMYETPAGRELVKHDAAFALVHRVAFEHLRHAAKENGRLKITFNDFEEWGISRARIGDAIAIADALGFIKRVKRGRASWEDRRESGEFAITWQSIGSDLPTNDWRRIFSPEAAQAKVAHALKLRLAERTANSERNKPRHLRKRPKTQYIAAS
jgi:hypothetical protein